MDIEKFVRDNRREIDDKIRVIYPNYAAVDDEDREDILRNDENLYNWALSEGVDI